MKALSFIALTFFISPFQVKNSPNKNLLVISMDGVREEDSIERLSPIIEVFNKKNLTTNWYGSEQNCQTSNPSNISLPAYSIVFSGKVDPRISDNFFYGKLKGETIFSLYDFHLFSSWKNIKMVMGNTSNAHIVPGSPYIFEDELVVRAYLKYSSKLSFIHFSDADEFAHIGRLDFYLKSIEYQVKHIETLVERSGASSFIIFTDHGRYDFNKRHHGRNLKGSERIWILTALKETLELEECSHIGVNRLIHKILEN